MSVILGMHSLFLIGFCSFNIADIRDSNGRSPLDLALSSFGPGNDPLDLPLYLINSGYGGIEKKTELLFRGCYYGQLDVVKEMVEQHNVDPKGDLFPA